MFTLRVSDDVRATRLASKLMRFCVSGDALETMRAAPPEPPATTMLNAPLGVFSMGAPLVSSGRNCICPEICCKASRCRLPMGRAFAVKEASRMDTWVVSGTGRAGFARRAGGPGKVKRDQVRICRRTTFSYQHCGASGTPARSQGKRAGCRSYCAQHAWNRPALQGASSILHRIPLPAAERSRICSEGDVRHGSSGDRQRS